VDQTVTSPPPNPLVAPNEAESPRASLVQDVWLGCEPRVRGRRLAPFEPPDVRIAFVPSLGMSLDAPVLVRFLETLASRAEVVSYEPASRAGADLGSGLREMLVSLVESCQRWWPSERPLFVAGHGLGASLALSLLDEQAIRGAAALSPWLLPFDAEPEALHAVRPSDPVDGVRAFLQELDLPRRARSGRGELLLVAGREDRLAAAGALAELAREHPATVLATIPGGAAASLEPPWARVVAAWAEELGRHPWSAAIPE
jgi:hypothetical protein